MFLADFRYITFWWLTINLFALTFLPLTFSIFPKFFDRGYIFAKMISLAVVTYIIFCLGVIKLVPFTSISIFGVLIIVNILNLYYLFIKGNFASFKISLRQTLKYIILEESIFFALLVIWSIVRSYAPDIEGLEKYMDWGFINSALRTQFLPPADMWYAGQSINYYYFGHLIFACLTKASSIPSSITYNLSIATLCALVFTSGFSLVANVASKHKSFLLAGLFSALLLTFGGNLHPVYKILKNDYTANNNHLVFTVDALKSAASTYWYPDATRFIGFDPDVNNKTIHEFPLYSFVVADLHGHLNDIPLVILFMAFLLASAQGFKKARMDLNLILGSGFLLSVAYMTNAWDFAIYGLFFGFFLLLLHRDILITIGTGVLTIIFWYLFTLPYSLNFTPMADGIMLVDARSPIWQLCILYGGFWLLSLPFVVWFVKHVLKKDKDATPINTSDIFAISLIVVATILVIIPEIIYIKDIYIFEHRRANTMFKLVYEAFIMYSLVSGYILVRFRKSVLYRLLFFIVLIAHSIYPYFAIKSYGDNHPKHQYWGLSGTDYLKTEFPDNFALINWLNSNVTGQPHILEAVGDSYTKLNQISSATGLPTVEGWVVHEWLWRGGYDGPGGRSTDVSTIYESADAQEAITLLQKYSVKYIVVGNQEREKYPNLSEDKFLKFSHIVFQSGETKLYQMN